MCLIPGSIGETQEVSRKAASQQIIDVLRDISRKQDQIIETLHKIERVGPSGDTLANDRGRKRRKIP